MAKPKVDWKKVWEEFENWSYKATKHPPTMGITTKTNRKIVI